MRMTTYGYLLVSAATLLLAVASGIPAPEARAATITIDPFEAPDPGEAFFTFNSEDDPPFVPRQRALLETSDGGILGGERDVLMEVVGAPTVFSGSGEVGLPSGILQFGTYGEAPVKISLQYDGLDAGDSTADGLVDAEGLADVDLTDGGSNWALEMQFVSLDAGDDPMTDMTLKITAVGDGGSATYEGLIAESVDPFEIRIPFADFSDSSVMESVGSLTFSLNGSAAPTANVDFELDNLAAVPEPSTLILLIALAGCSLVTTGIVRHRGRNRSV